MIDLNFIRKNKTKIKKAIEKKNIGLNLDELLKLDNERRALIKNVDDLRRRQNDFNKRVIQMPGNEKQKAIDGMKLLANELRTAELALKENEKKFNDMLALVPNIPSDDTPVGLDEKSNVEVEKWGQPPKFDFKVRSHVELGESLDIIDLERGANTSGFRGYYLKNEGAILHLAVLNYALRKIISKGFSPMITPVIVREFTLFGSGHFPFAKEDIYELKNSGEPLYLAGTSEPSLLAYFANRILDEKDLPIKVCGFSPCFRSEVGSYGKDTKGLYRVHEFAKVEQVVLCRADEKESDKWLIEMRGYAEEIIRDLGLPYRVVQVATGDMGAGKRKMYDIETWMPSRSGYGETHSDSDLTDWQTRRLNIRYKNQRGEKVYPYALNNTVIASPRILIAIIENFQQKDGSVRIPKPLVEFCGFDKILPKK